MKQDFIYLLLIATGVVLTLTVQTRKHELIRLWNNFFAARKDLRTIDYETPAVDPETVKHAQTVLDIRRSIAIEAAKSVIDLINTYIVEKEISQRLRTKFQQHFIEFVPEDERLPHMLSLETMRTVVTVDQYLDFTSSAYSPSYGIWVKSDDMRMYRFFTEFAGVSFQLSITDDHRALLHVDFASVPWDLQCGLNGFFKYIEGNEESLVTEIYEEAQAFLEGLCDNTPHCNNNNIVNGSFEDVIVNMGYSSNRYNDAFLLEFIDNELDSRSAFFDPLAFGQAVLEGAFTIDELLAADVHGYFNFTEGYDDTAHGPVIDVYVPLWTFGNIEVQLASTIHKAAYTTPQAFTEMPLTEFMFYYYQLGMLLKGLFIQKHPELIVKAHDNLWS